MKRTAVIGLILGALILAACGQKSGVHLASGRNGALVNPDTGEVIGGAMAGSAVAIQSDGSIIVAGRSSLLRFTADGKPDSSFGQGGMVTSDFSIVRTLVEGDGKILALGNKGQAAGAAE